MEDLTSVSLNLIMVLLAAFTIFCFLSFKALMSEKNIDAAAPIETLGLD
jgi:hypothetical protein